MGRACRICDRKFFLQAVFQQYAAQIGHYAQESAEIEEKMGDVLAQVDDIEEQKAEVDTFIRAEEQRYQAADVNQRDKLGEVQAEQDQMSQEKETLIQQLRYRNELLSKMKRKVTDVDIQKEQLQIRLQRENIKLRESNLQLEQVQKEVDYQQAHDKSKLDPTMRRSGSKTFFQPKMTNGIVGEEFEVIDPDDLGSRTVTS